MDRATHQSIARRLDFRRPLSRLLLDTTVTAALGAACVLLVGSGDWRLLVAAQFLLPVLYFRSFSLMHEAVHHSASKNRVLNDIVGVVGGVFCFTPYESWRRMHLEHHMWAGNIGKDPTAKLRKDYDPERRWKYRILSGIWRSWIPLMALLQLVVFWAYPLQQLRRPDYGVRTKLLIATSVLVPWLTYAAAWAAFPQLARPEAFLPSLFLYLMTLEVINFPHHLEVYAYDGPDRIAVPDQWLVTRSSVYPRWLARHFVLNFNLHIEHHLFPSLPWHQLDAARTLVKEALGAKYNESVGNAWIRKNRKLDLERFLPVQPLGDGDRLRRVG